MGGCFVVGLPGIDWIERGNPLFVDVTAILMYNNFKVEVRAPTGARTLCQRSIGGLTPMKQFTVEAVGHLCFLFLSF